MKALLSLLQTNVFEVINPPTALGGGHRGVVDKAARLVYAWSLHAPCAKALASKGAEYGSHTSDT